MNTYIDLITKEKEFVDHMLETRDRNALKMYVTEQIISWRWDFIKYARMFGLCRLLGVTNLYDIGCGNQYNALMLPSDMTYLGIDCDEKVVDFAEMNRVFSHDFFDGRIKFMNAWYPLDISPLPNNAAIACGWAWDRPHEEKLKNEASAMSRDFERIITNAHIFDIVTADSGAVEYKYQNYDEIFNFWESALPDFKVYKLDGKDKIVFATRVQKDVDIMNEVGYNFLDDRFMIRTVELQEILAKLHGK